MSVLGTALLLWKKVRGGHRQKRTRGGPGRPPRAEGLPSGPSAGCPGPRQGAHLHLQKSSLRDPGARVRGQSPVPSLLPVPPRAPADVTAGHQDSSVPSGSPGPPRACPELSAPGSGGREPLPGVPPSQQAGRKRRPRACAQRPHEPSLVPSVRRSLPLSQPGKARRALATQHVPGRAGGQVEVAGGSCSSPGRWPLLCRGRHLPGERGFLGGAPVILIAQPWCLALCPSLPIP